MTQVTTSATYKTLVTADLPDFALRDITFRLVAAFFNAAGEEVIDGKTYTMTLDASGVDDGSFYLPTPDNTGTAGANWFVTLPSGYEDIITVTYSGAAQAVADLLAAGATTTDPDVITAALAAKQAKDVDATNGYLAVFLDGQTVAGTGAPGSAALADAEDFEVAGAAAAVEASGKARFAGPLSPANLSYYSINTAFAAAVGAQPTSGAAATILHGSTFYHAVFGDDAWRLYDMATGELVIITDYLESMQSLSPIAYWPQDESSGSTAEDASGNNRDGAYSGVTLAQVGSGDGRTAPSWPGTAAYNNVYSTSLRDAFRGDRGSVSLLIAAASSGVWTDNSTRLTFGLRVNASNYVQIQKSSTNVLAGEYCAGGTLKTFGSSTAGYAHLRPDDTEWHHVAVTWDKARDRMRFYWHGAQAGPDQTGLGTWSGTIASTQSVVGALTTGAAFWSGRIAHVAVFDRELTRAEMQQAAGIYYRPSLLGFGDSVTAGVGATGESAYWLTLVRAGMGYGATRNSGATSTVLQNTTQTTVTTIGGAASGNGRDTVATRVTAYHADWVFILYGLNDLRLNDAAFTAALFQADLSEVVDAIIQSGTPADRIVIGSPSYIPAASYALGAPYDGGTEAKHREYRDACQLVARTKTTRFVDIYQKMIDGGGDTLMNVDGIHPNDAGHALIAAAFLSVL